MKNISLTTQLLLICSVSLLFSINATAKSDYGALRRTGDYLQIINPIIGAGFASQEKGFGHFTVIYAETMGIMYGTKFLTKDNKWQISKRPKKARYDGMPSGHMASAFVAASYIRTFSEDYKWLSVPLYVSGAVTGYSRIKCKAHTTAQVIAGAVLAEVVTLVNSKLEWSKDYQTVSFDSSKGAVRVMFKF